MPQTLNQQVKSGKMDAKVVAYLLGKDSGLSFNTMTKAQLDEFKRGVTSLGLLGNNPKQGDKFESYISHMFNELDDY